MSELKEGWYFIRSKAHPEQWVGLRDGKYGDTLLGQKLNKGRGQKVRISLDSTLIAASPCY